MPRQEMGPREPEPGEDQRLNEEEAHDEANLMRAFLKEGGHDMVKNLTKDDYDNALKEVEKIKKEATEESSTKIIAKEIGQAIRRAGQAAELLGVLVLIPIEGLLRATEVDFGPSTTDSLIKEITNDNTALACLKRCLH